MMEWWSWLGVIALVVFWPSVAALLLWRRLVERQYFGSWARGIHATVRDVREDTGEYDS